MFSHKSFELFFKQFPLKYWSLNNRLFIAVSGGRDSLFLLTYIASVFDAKKICVLHVNHGMRSTSLRDEKLVKKYCDQLGIEFRVKSVNIYSEPNQKGIENTARRLRYAWFAENCKTENGALFCGHTLDDQLETVLMNIYRGTGIAGLSGMSFKTFQFEVNVYRPLLFVSRATITKQMKEVSITYCDDETNEESVFFRNKIRNLLIPKLSKSLLAKIISINLAANEILNKVIVPQISLFKDFLTIDLKEINSLPTISVNKTLDLIYKSLSIEGSPSRNFRLDFFAFLVDAKRVKLELPSFVICQKSRGKICFYHAKKMDYSRGFSAYRLVQNNSLGIWNNVKIVEPEKVFTKIGFYFILEDTVDLECATLGFLDGVEGAEKARLKKNMENQKIPSFFYKHWPIIYANERYYLSCSNLEGSKVRANKVLSFSGIE